MSMPTHPRVGLCMFCSVPTCGRTTSRRFNNLCLRPLPKTPHTCRSGGTKSGITTSSLSRSLAILSSRDAYQPPAAISPTCCRAENWMFPYALLYIAFLHFYNHDLRITLLKPATAYPHLALAQVRRTPSHVRFQTSYHPSSRIGLYKSSSQEEMRSGGESQNRLLITTIAGADLIIRSRCMSRRSLRV